MFSHIIFRQFFLRLTNSVRPSLPCRGYFFDFYASVILFVFIPFLPFPTLFTLLGRFKHRTDWKENIIRTIPQYRLYATSLLFLYDGATQDEIDSLDEESGIKYSPDVRMKIIDFAHAITDLHAPDVISAPYPPSHSKSPDTGYLKGLYSLKTYFKK